MLVMVRRPAGEAAVKAKNISEAKMEKTPSPPGNPDLTGDELQAVRDVKVGKPVTQEMQARLTQLTLAEERRGGFNLTNEGELRLVHAKPVVRKRY